MMRIIIDDKDHGTYFYFWYDEAYNLVTKMFIQTNYESKVKIYLQFALSE